MKDGYNSRLGYHSIVCIMELEKSLYELLSESECTRIFVITHCEMFDPYLSQMKNIQKQTGIKVLICSSLHMLIEPIMFSQSMSVDKRFLGYYKNYLNYMNEFGAEILVLTEQNEINFQMKHT
jgi:hypothetical protein